MSNNLMCVCAVMAWFSACVSMCAFLCLHIKLGGFSTSVQLNDQLETCASGNSGPIREEF